MSCLVKISKLLRTPILKNIYEPLLLPFDIFCKDFADIIYGKSSFRILEENIAAI